MDKVRKVIIPVAGLGTRFLPATKAQPKEMLPIVDKPVIQFLVEEAVACGIREVIFVTGKGKRAIEDHFDSAPELEAALAKKGRSESLKKLRDIEKMASFTYVRQKRPLGDGDAILSALHLIGENEPVAILFGDMLVKNHTPYLKELLDIYEEYGSTVMGLTRVPKKDTGKYGIAIGRKIGERTYKLDAFIEKPKAGETSSCMAAAGKNIITPSVINHLRKVKRKDGEELRLADAFILALAKGEAIYGHEHDGELFDCGSKLGFLNATVAYGLEHPETKDAFRKYLKAKLKD